MKKLIGFFLVCLCISLYSGATVYADENDGTEELVKYGEDWQKLMDLPVKLPEDGTMLFFNNSIFKWDVNTETYVIDEEGIKTKLTDKNDYDIFTFGLTDSTLWGICVGESYAYLYTEGADNYGSVEVLTDDFDECMMYCEPFKVEPCAHPDLLMLRLGDSFISSYNETYVLIFSGTTIDDCIYKIPITDVWRYMKGKKVESYIKDISIIAEDIIDGDLVIGKNIKLRWNAVGYPNTVKLDIHEPSGFTRTIDIADKVVDNSVSLEMLHCENGTYTFEVYGLYAYGKIECNISGILSYDEFLNLTYKQDNSGVVTDTQLINPDYSILQTNESLIIRFDKNYDVEIADKMCSMSDDNIIVYPIESDTVSISYKISKEGVGVLKSDIYYMKYSQLSKDYTGVIFVCCVIVVIVLIGFWRWHRHVKVEKI